MITPVRRAMRRRQRARRRCAACGQPGTGDTPLMFVAETNRYYHYPYCMPVGHGLNTTARERALSNSAAVLAEDQADPRRRPNGHG